MNKMIVHIPFAVDEHRASASQIRPLKMVEAFKAIGFEVHVIEGYARSRSAQIAEVKRRIKNGEKFDFCYSESSTMPTLLTEKHHLPTSPFLDFGFFKFLKQNMIPIGLFYRDIHWKFEQYEVSSLKKHFARFFYKYDLKKYRQYVDILFLPSMEMKEHVPELSQIRSEALPPGLDHDRLSRVDDTAAVRSKLNILYVGGLGVLYDLSLILKCIAQFNQEVTLTVCCRSSDYEMLDDDYKELLSASNILITHQSGTNLDELYAKADIGCLFVKPIDYWAFAMPMKLFEYIAHQKPVIAAEGTAPAAFIAKHDIGWSIPFNEAALNEWLVTVINERAQLSYKKDKIAGIREENTWDARAGLVKHLLTDIPVDRIKDRNF